MGWGGLMRLNAVWGVDGIRVLIGLVNGVGGFMGCGGLWGPPSTEGVNGGGGTWGGAAELAQPWGAGGECGKKG